MPNTTIPVPAPVTETGIERLQDPDSLAEPLAISFPASTRVKPQDLLVGLDEHQKQAVVHDQGNLLVVAGPGSGKTRVLTHRVAHLILNRHVRPEEIMAITFTKKAAQEMRNRLDTMLAEHVGSKQLDNMWIRTIHSACVAVLRSHAHKIEQPVSYGRNFSIFDDADCRRVLREIYGMFQDDLEDLSSGAEPDSKQKTVSKWAKRIGLHKSAGGNIKTLRSQFEGKTYEDEMFGKVCFEYQSRLENQNAMDYDDLLLNVCRLFRDNPTIAEAFGKQFSHVLVDEYQDVNAPQAELIDHLRSYGATITAVGDPNQSIYGFRGASVGKILEFQQQAGADRVELKTNYRSYPQLVSATSNLISHNKKRIAMDFRSVHESDKADQHLYVYTEFDDTQAENHWIVATLQQLHKDHEINFSDMAVLFRTNREVDALELELLRHEPRMKIPYRKISGTPFFERQVIKNVLAYAKFASNPKDQENLRRAISSPKRGCGDKKIDQMIAHARQSNIELWEVLNAPESAGVKGPKITSTIADFVKTITTLQSSLTKPAPEFITDIFELSGYLEFLGQEVDKYNRKGDTEKKSRAKRELNYALLLPEIAAEYPNIVEFLDGMVADDTSPDVEERQQDKGVSLATIHKSKGLEFKVVFMPGVPSDYRGGAEHDEATVEEERRIIYVGLTRAEEYLFVTGTYNSRIDSEMRQSSAETSNVR